ncbi:MAG: hypothetical protein MJ056_08570, partial [Akkermansia sp.]|nr:hypothetical protein [Akkermansia sp.]
MYKLIMCVQGLGGTPLSKFPRKTSAPALFFNFFQKLLCIRSVLCLKGYMRMQKIPACILCALMLCACTRNIAGNDSATETLTMPPRPGGGAGGAFGRQGRGAR